MKLRISVSRAIGLIAIALPLPLCVALLSLAQPMPNAGSELPPELVKQFETLGGKYGHFVRHEIWFRGVARGLPSDGTQFFADTSSSAGKLRGQPISMDLDEILTATRREIDSQDAATEILPGFQGLTLPQGNDNLPNIGQPFGLHLGVWPGGWSTDKMLSSVASLDRINQSNQLWLIDLSQWTLLTRETFEQLARQKSLRHLVLNSTNISDQDLKTLSGLTNLQSLEMNDCSDSRRSYSKQKAANTANDNRLSSVGIASLSNLTNLRRLGLERCDLTDDALTNLGQLHHLEAIDLALNDALTDACLPELFKVKGLRQLNLSGCTKLTPSGLRKIDTLEQLKALQFQKTTLNVQALQSISRLKQLERLSLPFCPGITADGIRELGQLRRLELLDLSGSNLTDDDLKAVSSLTQLRNLRLSGCKAIKSGFKSLTDLKDLRELAIDSTNLDDEGLKEIANLKSLETLDLAGCSHISSVGLAQLARLPKLTRLRIDGCIGVTDAGLKKLAVVQTLEHLSAASCSGITDAGVKEIGQLPALRSLDVTLSPVTAAAFSDPSRFKSLRRLYCVMTRSLNAEQVAQSLPDCDVLIAGSRESALSPESSADPLATRQSKPRLNTWIAAASVLLLILALTVLLWRFYRRMASDRRNESD